MGTPALEHPPPDSSRSERCPPVSCPCPGETACMRVRFWESGRAVACSVTVDRLFGRSSSLKHTASTLSLPPPLSRSRSVQVVRVVDGPNRRLSELRLRTHKAPYTAVYRSQ
eukprot:6260934-Prymnesium_polylepis.1